MEAEVSGSINLGSEVGQAERVSVHHSLICKQASGGWQELVGI